MSVRNNVIKIATKINILKVENNIPIIIYNAQFLYKVDICKESIKCESQKENTQ